MTTTDKADEYTCPLSRKQVIDRYFLEHRAKLIDLAAFLDRVDRAAPQDGDGDGDADGRYRVAQMHLAIALLIDGRPQRAKRILDLFSDPTTGPIPAAPGKGATGAYQAMRED